MKELLRPLAAIITMTFSLTFMYTAKTFFAEDEAAIQIGQLISSDKNDSGYTFIYFQPDEFPTVMNETEALEVTGLAKFDGHYHLQLKNNSSKSVVAYFLFFGPRDRGHEEGIGHRGPLISPGDTHQEDHLSANSPAETIRIGTVVFDDDSFEGDLNLAAEVVARREGIRMQSISVLPLIDATLEVSDANLPDAFDKLQVQLAVIPEAIDKASAIELLKSRYPCFDKRMISSLYEYFKMGLYEGKNMAYCRVCNMQYYLRDLKEDSPVNKEAVQSTLIRERLNEIKQMYKGVSKISDNRI
jgi:hypothetical protein